MKKYLSTALILLIINVSYSQKHKYENDNLKIPEWLTNPNYISENENTEEGQYISINEIIVGKIQNYEIVKVWLDVEIYNSGRAEVYLATFNNKKMLTDIIFLQEYTTSDWNGVDIDELTIRNNTICRFTVENAYAPAEPDENGNVAYGGIVLSSSDTTQEYYRLDENGKLFSVYDASGEEFDEDNCVENIRAEVSTIYANSKNYKVVTKDLVENNVLMALYDDGMLKKINVTIYIETDKETEEYFYDNDKQLIFAFLTVKSTKDENRYYFYNNKMVRYLKGSAKLKIETNSTIFAEKEKEILNKSEKYKKMLK